MNELRTNSIRNVTFGLVLLTLLFFFLLKTTIATPTGSDGEATLTIWDDTDHPDVEKFSNSNITFFANFTNSSSHIINDTEGNCTIRFDHLGSYGDAFDMLFNSSGNLWSYGTLISYKGIHNFQVNCTALYGNVTLSDTFIIRNSRPSVLQGQGGYIDIDNNPETTDYLYCTENHLCVYNFSANVTDMDLNDVLTFSYMDTNLTLTNFTLNAVTGILEINYTNDYDLCGGNCNGQSRVKLITLVATDTGDPDGNPTFDSGILRINITPENDPPFFLNLGGERIINKSGIELILQAWDEEEDVPYAFNVSFLSCVHASVNPPTGPDNCTIFNLTYYNETATNISLMPQGNQKGEYEINFRVTDVRNATYSTVVNWTISWNDPPLFTYICDDERNTTEDFPFTCYINASDTDELNNLTFIANYSWFTFDGTFSNITTISTAGTGNASALVSFTPTDSQVGNWSINITLIDTGAPNASFEVNSTSFYFFIDNVDDPVAISHIPNITAYTSQIYVVLVNGTDDDLLVTDKNVKDENLTFFSDNPYVILSNQIYLSGTNISQATFNFDPKDLGEGLHTINITVCDAGNHSCASETFKIDVLNNTAPQWNSIMETSFNLTEGEPSFYLNLSEYVTDKDPITFSLELLDSFGFGMTIDPATGIINFTPADADVGFHMVRIIASDGKTPSAKDFSFTVENKNDPLIFMQLLMPRNGTFASGLINTTEDFLTMLQLQISDDDLLIEQTSFYPENFTLLLNISGRNSTLFQFDLGHKVINNIYQFDSLFTPQKQDVGDYNITINITDAFGSSIFLMFNLTVTETLHPPNITTPIENVVLSILNESFYFDVNATDLEDGPDGEITNLTFMLQNLTARGNFLTINASTGVINFTSNSSLAGKWEFRVIVNDTHGSEDSEYFNMTIYDYPVILLPNSSYQFEMIENVSALLNFTVNHTVQDDLNYTLIIDGVTKNSTIGTGNGSEFIWEFTPNFTMETTTCSGVVNLVLMVSNSRLSNSTSWLVSINHTNHPLSFIAGIPDQSGGSPVTLDLSDYFYDVDAADPCVNQIILFNYTKINNSETGGVITVSLTDWSEGIPPTATFSAESDGIANFSITAYEYNVSDSSHILANSTSNEFLVSLTVQQAQPAPRAGGGGSRAQVVSLKILVPEPVSAKQRDKLIIPLGLENEGQVDLNRIYLAATIAKDGAIRDDLMASFDQSYFESLKIGERKNVTMIVDIETTSVGLFEVTINATVEEPIYRDWAKFYIQIEEDRSVLEKIIFTEEFIIGNPQCAELIDLINDAKKLFSDGDIEAASTKTEDALRACNNAITQPPRPRIPERLGDRFIGYTAIASLIALAIGFAYYTYKKISLNRRLNKELGKI